MATKQVAPFVLLANIAMIGNYFKINTDFKVVDILTRIMTGRVDLLPFFSGGRASTNDGISSTAWCRASSMMGAGATDGE
jgi:hypothetical protein